MRRKLILEDMLYSPNNDTNESLGSFLRNYFAQNAAKRSWPVYGMAKAQGSNELFLFQLKHELEFQWNNNAQQQIATLTYAEDGLTGGQLADDLNAIFQHEFTQNHGIVGNDNERQAAFNDRLKIKLKCGDIDKGEPDFIVNEVLQCFVMTEHDTGEMCDLKLQSIVGFMRNIRAQSENDQPIRNALNSNFFNDYFDCIIANNPSLKPDTVNTAIAVDVMRDPNNTNFKPWWNTILCAVALLPQNERQALRQKLTQGGYTLLRSQISASMAGFNPNAQQNGQQNAQQNAQPQQNGQQNATLMSQEFGTIPQWFSTGNVYVLGKMPFDQFQTWWQQQRPELKQAILGSHRTLKYMPFKGVPDESDTTVKRTTLVIWDRAKLDLKIYGQMTLPRKRQPLYNVLYAFRCHDFGVICPFVRLSNGGWHGHLYSLRNDHINNSPHGMRILYDPDGYLNALFANRPAGITLHDAGPGVPQTIGNHVTDDLTRNIPRTQLRPLTAQEQAALQRAREEADAQQQATQQQQQQLVDQMKTNATNISNELPDIFKSPEFKNLIQYWDGTTAQAINLPSSSKPEFQANPNAQYVIIRLPGSSSREIVGGTLIRMFTERLGIKDEIEPILDLIANRLPNATPMLKFNGKLS